MVLVFRLLTLSRELRSGDKKRGKIFRQSYASGSPISELKISGSVGKRNTGSLVRFLPDSNYFDTPSLNLSRLSHLLR